jgi:hypothetical protein
MERCAPSTVELKNGAEPLRNSALRYSGLIPDMDN